MGQPACWCTHCCEAPLCRRVGNDSRAGRTRAVSQEDGCGRGALVQQSTPGPDSCVSLSQGSGAPYSACAAESAQTQGPGATRGRVRPGREDPEVGRTHARSQPRGRVRGAPVHPSRHRLRGRAPACCRLREPVRSGRPCAAESAPTQGPGSRVQLTFGTGVAETILCPAQSAPTPPGPGARLPLT